MGDSAQDENSNRPRAPGKHLSCVWPLTKGIDINALGDWRQRVPSQGTQGWGWSAKMITVEGVGLGKGGTGGGSAA